MEVGSVEWIKDPYGGNTPRSQYLDIDVTLTCGCSINDRRTFAAQMKEQKGWVIATSGGWSKSGRPGGPTTYSLRARRKSLTRYANLLGQPCHSAASLQAVGPRWEKSGR